MFLVTINGNRIPVTNVKVTDRNGDTSLITLEAEARGDNSQTLVPWDEVVSSSVGLFMVVVEGHGRRWFGDLQFKESWIDLPNDTLEPYTYTGKAGLVLQGCILEERL